MNTINKLKLEIEELEVKGIELEEKDIYSGDLVRLHSKIKKLNIELQTLQEVCKEIEKWRECSCDYLQCNYCLKLNELLERFKGEENV